MDGDVVYFCGCDAWVYALDARSGVLKWSFQAQRSLLDASPAVGSGAVFVGGKDGRLYALDSTTGAKRWEVHRLGADGKEEASFGSPLLANQVVYCGCSDGHLYAFNAGTGEELWRYRLNITLWTITSHPGGNAGRRWWTQPLRVSRCKVRRSLRRRLAEAEEDMGPMDAGLPARFRQEAETFVSIMAELAPEVRLDYSASSIDALEEFIAHQVRSARIEVRGRRPDGRCRLLPGRGCYPHDRRALEWRGPA